MSPFYPRPGALLAERFRVGEVIGKGGMGVVLEAQNIVTQRRVAVKWILGGLGDSEEAAERLVREACAASLVSHPNVVDVYDVLRDGDAVFLVMELLKGEPLSALLARGGVPVHELASVLIPAMRGVAEAHRLGIVHRDIHPGNIFLAREGQDIVPKVLDFGISKIGPESGKKALTRSNICMGTPLYMSYEQLCSARDVDQRTDVYSFGVVLYEALTGQRPYDGQSMLEVAGKVAAGNPVHPKRLRPELPSALAELVMWAMACKKEDRLDSMEGFIAELEPFASNQAFRAQMTNPDAPTPVLVGRRSSAVSIAPVPAPLPPRDSVEAHRPRVTSPSIPGAPEAHAAPARASFGVDTAGRVNTPLAQSVRMRGANKTRRMLSAGAALVTGAVVCGGGFWYATRPATPDLAARRDEAPAALPAAIPASPGPSSEPTKPVVVQPTPVVAAATDAGQAGAPDAARPMPGWQKRWLEKQAALKLSAQQGQPSPPPAPQPAETSKPSSPTKRAADGFRAGEMRMEDLLPQH